MSGYRVPEWRQSIGQNQFEVEVEGQRFMLIKAEYLTGNQVEELQVASAGNPGRLYDFMNTLSPGLGDALRPVPVKFMNEFVLAWQQDAGIELGESLGSSPSSESTEKPSSTTSSPMAIA